MVNVQKRSIDDREQKRLNDIVSMSVNVWNRGHN